MSGNHLQVPGMSLDGASDYGGSQGNRGSQHGGSPARSVGGRSQHGGSQGPSPARSVGGRSQTGGSQQGSPARSIGGRSATGSQQGFSDQQTPGQPRPSPFGPSLGYDPALDPETIRQREEDEKRKKTKTIDLPAEAFQNLKTGRFAHRPGFNNDKTAKQINLNVNQFRFMDMPRKTIYQYDVAVNTDRDARVIIQKLWESQPWQEELKGAAQGGDKTTFLYDGSKICWSTVLVPNQLRKTIDLDAASGGGPSNRPNTFTIQMTHTGSVDLGQLLSYLKGQVDWNEKILESMTFIDHVIRTGPAARLHAIGRSYFPSGEQPQMFNLYMGAKKGIYMSARLNQSITNGGMGIGVNVDVTNSCFWMGDSFDRLIRFYLTAQSPKLDNRDIFQLCNDLQSEKVLGKVGGDTNWYWGQSDAFRWLRKLHKLKFSVQHRGRMGDTNTYTLKKFAWDENNGHETANAKNTTFTMKRTGETLSIAEHLKKKYNVTLNYPDIPLLVTNRDGMFPAELCILKPMQKYNFKLSAKETSDMIKFAVTRPNVRAKHIMENVGKLAWGGDPYLSTYGIKIHPQMSSTQAKLLQNPEVQFGNGKINPKVSGRWDLRGRTFVTPNTVPIANWGVIINNACIDKPAVQKFMGMFVETFKKHGGRVTTPQPYIYNSSPNMAIHQAIQHCYDDISKQGKGPPQIIFVVLGDKAQHVYERCKKSMECRYAIMSQCMQRDHVAKCNPQYASNVSMKVLLKMGGQVSRIAHPGNKNPWFNAPTMIIGADISHGSHGQQVGNAYALPIPSIAGMVVSMDKDAATYAATCQTNGYRREIMNDVTIEQILKEPATAWKGKHGIAPKHVFYFRDGVSEGEFSKVVEIEVAAIRKVLKEATGGDPKITAIVATKRHHLRFFPEGAGDKNANPFPGTLVEREITHPFQYDFYLCSHVAIQGTARPVHYHVLIDEIQMPVNALQDMIYKQCYQYQRATTPVSLHPAVYYAHLACDRARAHENEISALKDPKVPKKTEGIYAQKAETAATHTLKDADAPELLPFGGKEADAKNQAHIKLVPWYI